MQKKKIVLRTHSQFRKKSRSRFCFWASSWKNHSLPNEQKSLFSRGYILLLPIVPRALALDAGFFSGKLYLASCQQQKAKVQCCFFLSALNNYLIVSKLFLTSGLGSKLSHFFLPLHYKYKNSLSLTLLRLFQKEAWHKNLSTNTLCKKWIQEALEDKGECKKETRGNQVRGLFLCRIWWRILASIPEKISGRQLIASSVVPPRSEFILQVLSIIAWGFS